VVISPWEESSIDLPTITADFERVRAVWVSPAGVERDEGDDHRQVNVPVAILISDRRVVFVARGGDDDSPSGTYTLTYSDLAGVDEDEDYLILTTTGGVVWRVPFPSDLTPAHDTVRRHLCWLGELRSRIVSCANDVELATGEIREHAHALDWQRARKSYSEVREDLDTLICDVQLVTPVPTKELAPELGGIERRLERAHTRLYIERAKAALAMGRHLIQDEEYDGARERLREAQRFYDRARAQSDAARRGDAFQFGPQRELQDDLENLGWEIETVAAEPIRQAHEAKIEAQFLDDPEESLDRWETALRRYGHVLTLEWDDDGRNFAGDPDEVRRDRETAAGRIVDVREELARQEWNAGATHQENGQYAAALEQCSTAVDHLERVLALAEEFDVADPSATASRVERMEAVVDALRQHVAGGEPGPDVSRSEAGGVVGPYEGAGEPDAREHSGSDTGKPGRADDRSPNESESPDGDLDSSPDQQTGEPANGDGKTSDETGDRAGQGPDADGGALPGSNSVKPQTASATDGTGEDTAPDPEGQTTESEPPSVASLSNLDVHHEITVGESLRTLGSSDERSAAESSVGDDEGNSDATGTDTDADGTVSDDEDDTDSSPSSGDVHTGTE